MTLKTSEYGSRLGIYPPHTPLHCRPHANHVPLDVPLYDWHGVRRVNPPPPKGGLTDSYQIFFKSLFISICKIDYVRNMCTAFSCGFHLFLTLSTTFMCSVFIVIKIDGQRILSIIWILIIFKKNLAGSSFVIMCSIILFKIKYHCILQ